MVIECVPCLFGKDRYLYLIKIWISLSDVEENLIKDKIQGFNM